MIRHCVTYRIIQHISPFTEHERVRRAVQLFVRESGAPQVKQFNRRRSKLSKRLIDKLRARDVTKRTHGGQSRVRNARFPRRITDRVTRSNPIQSNPIASPRNRASRDNRPPPPSPPSSSRALDSDATHLWILSRAMFKRFQRPSRRPSRVSTSRASFPPHRRPHPTLARRLLHRRRRRLPPTIVLPVRPARHARRPGRPRSPSRRGRGRVVARGRRHPARRGRLPRCIRSVARHASTLISTLLSTLSKP